MAGVKHTFSSLIADDASAAAAGQVLPSHWNAEHTLSDVAAQTALDAVSNAVSIVSNALSNEVSNRVSADNVVSAQAASALSQALSVLSVALAALSGRADSAAQALSVVSNAASNALSVANAALNAASIVSNALSNEISNRASADNVVSAQAASALSQMMSVNSVNQAGLSTRIDSVANAISVVSNALSAQKLSAHADVSITAPTSGQVLKYQSASGKWVNSADATGGGGGSVTSAELVAGDNAVSAQAASALSQALSVLSVALAGLSSRADSIANNASVISNALSNEISNRLSGDSAVSAQAASAISHLQSVLSQRISALSIKALKDVSITAPTSGQVLKYQSASGQWVNSADATGGAGGSVTSTEVSAVSAQAASALSQALSVLSVTDAGLSSRIDSVANGVSVVSNALSNEISNRTSADNVVSAQAASALSQARSALSVVDAGLSSRVDSVANAISVVSNALSNEISNRNSAINVASAQAASAISQLQSLLSQRISALSIDALKGVSISGITSGQVLKWNSAAGEWQNMADATGGGAGSVTSNEASAISAQAASAISQLNSVVSQLGSVLSVRIDSVANAVSVVSNKASALSVDIAGVSSRVDSVLSVLSQRISALSVDALKGVSISGITSGQVLKWDSAAANWRNMSDNTAGGGGSVTSTELSVAVSALNNVSAVSSPSGSVVIGLQSVIDTFSNMFSNAFSAGNVISQAHSVLSAKVSAGIGQSVQRREIADVQSVQTSTLTNVSGLSVSVEAGGDYEIEGVLFVSTSAATAGLKAGFTFPTLKGTGARGYAEFQAMDNVGSARGMMGNLSGSGSTLLSMVSVGAAGVQVPVHFEAYFRVSTAGVVQLQAAGIASVTASPLHFIAGSWMKAYRV